MMSVREPGTGSSIAHLAARCGDKAILKLLLRKYSDYTKMSNNNVSFFPILSSFFLFVLSIAATTALKNRYFLPGSRSHHVISWRYISLYLTICGPVLVFY